MRIKTLVLTLLLSASALALAPTAQAAEVDPCPPLDAQSLAGSVTLEYDAATNTCTYTVGLVDGHRVCGMFAGMDHRQVRQEADLSGASGGHDVHVVVNYCVPIIYCTCDPIVVADDVEDLLAASTASAALQPPIYCVMAPCGPYPTPVWCTVKAATPGDNPYSTLNPRQAVWGSDAGCDVDADTTDLYACAPPSGVVVDRTVGPVHAVLLVCDGGLVGLVLRLVETVVEAIGPLVST